MNLAKRDIKRVLSKSIIYLKKVTFKGHQPDFIIAGAQKSGTSSLHYYLSQHPNLLGSVPKEVQYFSRDANFNKGKKWYQQSFINLNSDKKNYLCFEATPVYMYRSFVAERMRQEYPHLKIIMILREPVKRAYSAWNMYRDFGYMLGGQYGDDRKKYSADEFPSFEKAVDEEMLIMQQNPKLEEPGLLRRGIYLPQIQYYHETFGKENILVLGFIDLIKNKTETLNKVLKFLSLEQSDWSFLNQGKQNARVYDEKMNKELEEKLNRFYEPHNKALFNYLNTEINW